MNIFFFKFCPNDENTPDNKPKGKVKSTLEKAIKPVASRYTNCAIPAQKHASYLSSNTVIFSEVGLRQNSIYPD
jgi:hypothetical protein